MLSKRSSVPIRFVLFALITVAIGIPLTGCTTVDEVRQRIEQEGEERTDEAVDRAVEGTADATEEAIANAVRCVVGDDQCVREARDDGKPVVMTEADGTVLRDDNGDPVTDPEVAEAQVGEGGSLEPGEGVWANYDFVPGSTVLFYEDYTGDRVGDFPRDLEFVGGTLEVVERDGKRALRATSEGAFDITLPESLPSRFTVEFSMQVDNWQFNELFVYPVTDEGRRAGSHWLVVQPYYRIGIESEGGTTSTKRGYAQTMKADRLPVRLMADGAYVKVYVGTDRVANIPNADLGRSNTLRFAIEDGRSGGVFIGPIRVAAGGRDLYSTLDAEGRAATRGIQFDTGSAEIRPESTPALQDVARMLEAHPNLRVAIEGHTDATGSESANRSLSQQRAEAVQQYLTAEAGIAPSRLRAIGKGESNPVASNDTAEGRQSNRRVELVKR
jgi:outer membrane protein OmpA-like peptidoglycan-associated protein